MEHHPILHTMVDLWNNLRHSIDLGIYRSDEKMKTTKRILVSVIWKSILAHWWNKIHRTYKKANVSFY